MCSPNQAEKTLQWAGIYWWIESDPSRRQLTITDTVDCKQFFWNALDFS